MTWAGLRRRAAVLHRRSGDRGRASRGAGAGPDPGGGIGRARQALLVALAGLRRRRLRRVAFVAVTGSCGKTTTKELIAAVLESRFTGRKTPASYSNLEVIARTVLATRRRDGFAVLEFGTWGPGTLAAYARVARPDVGVVTNVGLDHYTAFRSRAAVAAEKATLVSSLPATGVAVLNADDPHVAAMGPLCAGRVLTFGLGESAAVRGEDPRGAWPERLTLTVAHGADSVPVRTRLCGVHWAPAVLAALATGLALGVPLREGAAALAAVEPRPGRMSPVETPRGVTFIRDDWKCSLWSIPAALDFLRGARATRRIVVIGTISDVPGATGRKYRQVAQQALAAAELVLFVGPQAKSCRALAASEGRLRVFDAVPAAKAFLRTELAPGDLVLLKGSFRADRLDRLV